MAGSKLDKSELARAVEGADVFLFAGRRQGHDALRAAKKSCSPMERRPRFQAAPPRVAEVGTVASVLSCRRRSM
eukprot:6814675-Pyramimonas_sp.AAC.1